MRICRFDDNRLGVVEEGVVADVTPALDVLPPLRWPLQHGDHLVRHLDLIRSRSDELLSKAPRKPLSQVKLLSPIANPSKILAAPANYKSHLLEAANDAGINHGTHQTVFPEGGTPVSVQGLFLKATSSIVGSGEGVRLTMPERRNDHEIELAVVIGQECRNIGEEDAPSVIAGFCLGLDMTIRGPEDRSFRKSPDGYTVLGPWLVTADEISDPSSLGLRLSVNGEPRQSSSTSDLTVGLNELIVVASRWYTLYPGDVLLTGTPDGVGPVKSGDRMTAWIERVGEMDVVIH